MTFKAPGPPSRNPTIDGKLKSVLGFVFRKLVQTTLDDMLPAMVVAYDRTTNMATVQPLISMVTTLNEIVPRGPIAQVPVSQWGAGGFMMNFPVKKGDLGWIKANDRDISLFTQIWGMVIPNTLRMHSFSDGTFLPVALVNFIIAASDANNLVLQKLDGSVRFSIGSKNTCISDTVGYAQSENCILDVQSTTRAFAFPRMTSSQILAIPDPFPGMAAYDITTDGLRVYTAAGGWGI